MFLCVGFGNNIIYASGGAVLEASSTVTEKDKAVVDIDLKGNTGIWALKFKVGYNHLALKLKSVQNGEVFSKGDITEPEKLDKDEYVFLASSNSVKNIENSGTVVRLNFKIVDYALEGDYPIKVTLVQAIDAKGNVVDMDTEDGNVNVYYEVKKNDIVFDKSKSENIKIPTGTNSSKESKGSKESKVKVKKVVVNNKKVDKDNYTVDSDGNVEISEKYLNTLKDGKYKVTVQKGQKTYNTNFIVKTDASKKIVNKNKGGENSKANKKETVNGARQENGIIVVVVIAAVVIAGIAFVLVRKRREKQ